MGRPGQSDFSMEVWVQALARRASDAQTDPEAVLTYQRFVEQFVVFYRDKIRDFGPYRVCVTSPVTNLTGCRELGSSGFSEPERRNFQLLVSEGIVTALFDVSSPARAEAWHSMLLITVVFALMCGACFSLNEMASRFAVKPLERAMASIKTYAKGIFAAAHEDGGVDGDEVQLVQRVVDKLAVVARLAANKGGSHPDDELSRKCSKSPVVLAWTEGHTATSEPSREESGRRAGSKTRVSVTMHWQLEEICKEEGITFELLDSWDFDVLSIGREKLPELSRWLLVNHPGSNDYVEQNVDLQQLLEFAAAVGRGYEDNPFHNFMHAVDVLHGAFRYMKLMMVQC